MTDPPIRQQVMKYLAEQFPGATLADHQFGADGLLAIFDAEAARVCVEAVAEWAQIVAVIEQYLPEALPFNSLSEIVGGIARQRDFQHELKDHLAEVARRLTDGRDAAVARAVADERQRIETALTVEVNRVADVPADAIRNEAYWAGRVEGVLSARGLVAGSVPVATPEPSESYRACAGCDGPDLCKFCGYRAATPTEPLSDELLDKWAAAVTLPGEYAAQLVDEVRRLRGAVASPVPAVRSPRLRNRPGQPRTPRMRGAAEQPEER